MSRKLLVQRSRRMCTMPGSCICIAGIGGGCVGSAGVVITITTATITTTGISDLPIRNAAHVGATVAKARSINREGVRFRRRCRCRRRWIQWNRWPGLVRRSLPAGGLPAMPRVCPAR